MNLTKAKRKAKKIKELKGEKNYSKLRWNRVKLDDLHRDPDMKFLVCSDKPKLIFITIMPQKYICKQIMHFFRKIYTLTIYRQ